MIIFNNIKHRGIIPLCLMLLIISKKMGKMMRFMLRSERIISEVILYITTSFISQFLSGRDVANALL